MSKLFDFSQFESTNEFDYAKTRSNTVDLLLDEGSYIMSVKGKKFIFEDGELPLGESLIDFCFLNLLEDFSMPPAGIMQQTFSPRTPDEYFEIKEFLFTQSYTYIKNIADKHIYLRNVLPVFQNNISAGIAAYYGHLLFLQSQFREMIKITFDVDFYPEDVKNLSSYQRFHLYTISEPSFVAPPISKVLNSSRLVYDRKSKPKMAEGYIGIPAGSIESLVKNPVDFSFDYQYNTLYELLFLEFYLMLENDIKIKKCRNCGEYFAFKGNDVTDYCSKVREGETLTCQKIIANRNFKNKLSDNEAFGLYNKYYKRYFARLKVGTIKEPAFKKWQYEAISKRDLCADGQLANEDFEQFLMDSFPNRKRKENEK